MARIEKTVFISYRRADRWQALAVFKDLTQHGYDVFIDYDGIASGDFEHAIVDNIRARAHFIVVLTPTALERCDNPTDWLRREIEVALEAKRNIVPLLLDGFRFDAPIAVQRLQGSLEPLRRYQALEVPADFFDEAMVRLRGKRLAVAVEAVLHSASPHARQVAHEQHDAASKAADPSDGPTDAAEQNALGDDYCYGRNSRTQNDAEAVKWYRLAAEQGYAEGQMNLGLMYHQGRGGLAKDKTAAVKWYRLAAGQGYAEGQAALGLMYELGQGGLAKDDAAAVKWYRMAAEQGYAKAQAWLGLMYEQGRGGLAKDDAAAVKLYRMAAEQGYAMGQTSLGIMYLDGRGGLAKDETAAVKWYRMAAEQGYAMGQTHLGIMYLDGRGGLAKDETAAVKWCRMAAEQGDTRGQAALGFMYEQGRGLTKDRAQALKFYRQAAAQGDEYAQKQLKRLGEN